MPNYRRSRHGTTYFFTVVTYQRRQILCTDEARGALRQAIDETRASYGFLILAWVLLPDHIHCIWELPRGEMDYSIRMALIKKGFSKRAKAWLNMPLPSESRRNHRECTVWQRRFWEHTIRDEQDFSAHCDYIHYNPVKHGLVEAPKDWPYSTFHRFVERGVYGDDWGATDICLSDNLAGE